VDQTIHLKVVGGETRIPYDYLLYALGSSAQSTGGPGVTEFAYSIARPAESAALQKTLASSRAGARVAVIGGGLTGIETASEIAESYPEFRVSLWTGDRLGPGLSELGRDYIRETLSGLGIEVHERQRIAEVRPRSLVLDNGDEHPQDVSIWAGSFAVSQLARGAGLSVNTRGQILVDRDLRSVSDSRIYAAGDSACFAEDPGAPIRMACATAMPAGAHAADNLAAVIAGQPQEPFRMYYMLQCISLGRRRGLVQWVHGDDKPIEAIVKGRRAAFIKELICRSTTWALRLEKFMPGAYRWPGRGRTESGHAATVPQLR